MTRHGGRTRGLGAALAAALVAAPGCLSFLHPVDPPKRELAEPCAALPRCCRGHVYFFLVHGADPFDAANLGGLNDWVRSLGFPKTYYGQMYHYLYFEGEIRRIHHEDPDARFVLMGFSLGANMVRNIARDVKDEGVTIDLMVYCGGNSLANDPYNRPENVLQVAHILTQYGSDWMGTQIDGADNARVTDVFHFGSPTHLYTREMLARELAVVASRVPVSAGESGAAPPAEGPRDEWDFLKPAPPPAAAPAESIAPPVMPKAEK
jgi:hypothetical protein